MPHISVQVEKKEESVAGNVGPFNDENVNEIRDRAKELYSEKIIYQVIDRLFVGKNQNERIAELGIFNGTLMEGLAITVFGMTRTQFGMEAAIKMLFTCFQSMKVGLDQCHPDLEFQLGVQVKEKK